MFEIYPQTYYIIIFLLFSVTLWFLTPWIIKIRTINTRFWIFADALWISASVVALSLKLYLSEVNQEVKLFKDVIKSYKEHNSRYQEKVQELTKLCNKQVIKEKHIELEVEIRHIYRFCNRFSVLVKKLERKYAPRISGFTNKIPAKDIIINKENNKNFSGYSTEIHMRSEVKYISVEPFSETFQNFYKEAGKIKFEHDDSYISTSAGLNHIEYRGLNFTGKPIQFFIKIADDLHIGWETPYAKITDFPTIGKGPELHKYYYENLYEMLISFSQLLVSSNYLEKHSKKVDSRVLPSFDRYIYKNKDGYLISSLYILWIFSAALRLSKVRYDWIKAKPKK
ncbi:hypothetical protein [Pseudoalteromonas rubra]|uniref:hypothetical protein n=1 Tax=Pseudoalteromonas rubra TaxID=43658 RepID=UPI000F7B31C1|nr:hypothetical protein [Pseudoalteromonas rubra]